MKFEDRIVEEVRAVREAIAKEQDYDLAKIAHAAKVVGDKTDRTLESRPARRIVPVQKAS